MEKNWLHNMPCTHRFVEQGLSQLRQAQATPKLQNFVHKTNPVALLSVSSLDAANIHRPPLNWNFNKFYQRYEPTLEEAIIKFQELSQPFRLDISALINL